jgi:hypothetical protein
VCVRAANRQPIRFCTRRGTPDESQFGPRSGPYRPISDQRCRDTVASHEGAFIERSSIGTNDNKEERRRRGRSHGSPDHQLSGTAYAFQKLFRVEQLLAAIRTGGQVILHAVALSGGESAVEIGRNLYVGYVIASRVR